VQHGDPSLIGFVIWLFVICAGWRREYSDARLRRLLGDGASATLANGDFCGNMRRV
jgi:hypothetical protein